MLNRLNTYGNVMITTPDDMTAGDVRDFVSLLNLLQVPDSTPLLEGMLSYEYQTQDVELINCADHAPNEERLDFIVTTHSHKERETNE